MIPGRHPVRLRGYVRAAALLTIALAGASFAGCAADVVDPAKTEIVLKFDIEEKTGTKVRSVACPSDVEAIEGARFSCTVIARDGVEALAEIEILNDNADLKVLRLSNP